MMINEFIFEKIIGRGVTSIVIRASHCKTKEKYAIKSISKKALNKVGTRRIYNERNIMKKLDHPYINKLYYALQDPNHLYFVTEYTPCGDLFDCMSTIRISQEAAWFYLMEILCALRYIHQSGYIYGDMKPENVLIGNDGHVLLTDFGCSIPISEAPTADISGTALYFSPEMVIRDKTCQANDVWALGIIGYELYAGRLPWYNQHSSVMYDMIINVKLCFDNIPEDSKKMITQMTVVDEITRDTCDELYKTFVSDELDVKLRTKALTPPYKPKPIKTSSNHFSDFDVII